MTTGTLYLIPVTLGETDTSWVLPPDVINIARSLEYFVVENEKTARRFMGLLHPTRPIRDLKLSTLNTHSTPRELPDLLRPLQQGHDVGLMSEAGCPGIADPGALLIELAHRHRIRVKPLVGPSSILLALMASGLNGQQFAFHGYLPTEKTARCQRIRQLEQESRKQHQTQIFIETPYRNPHVLEDMLAVCHNDTRICLATNLTTSGESVITSTIKGWKTMPLPDLHKQPTVFLMLA